MTPAQVVADYPHLTMAQVHAALAHCWSHPDEIHQDIEDEAKLVVELKGKAGPSKIQERLAERNASDPGTSTNRTRCETASNSSKLCCGGRDRRRFGSGERI